MKIDTPTDQEAVILKACEILFDRYYEELPIRQIQVSVGKLNQKIGVQLTIFEDFEQKQKEDHIHQTLDEVTLKFGKNSLVKAANLLPDSTAMERNKKIGGHMA